MPTTADLGAVLKTKYPGRFDHIPDADLGATLRDRYPQRFTNFVDAVEDAKPPRPRKLTPAEAGQVPQQQQPQGPPDPEKEQGLMETVFGTVARPVVSAAVGVASMPFNLAYWGLAFGSRALEKAGVLDPNRPIFETAGTKLTTKQWMDALEETQAQTHADAMEFRSRIPGFEGSLGKLPEGQKQITPILELAGQAAGFAYFGSLSAGKVAMNLDGITGLKKLGNLSKLGRFLPSKAGAFLAKEVPKDIAPVVDAMGWAGVDALAKLSNANSWDDAQERAIQGGIGMLSGAAIGAAFNWRGTTHWVADGLKKIGKQKPGEETVVPPERNPENVEATPTGAYETFKTIQRQNSKFPEQTEATLAIWDQAVAHAEKLGIHKDDFFHNYLEQPREGSPGEDVSVRTDGKREVTAGRIIKYPDGAWTIELTQHENPISFLHESSHGWLDMIRFFAEKAPKEQDREFLNQDLWTLNRWLGAKDHNWTEEQEHKFSDAVMEYLNRGKAPKPELQGIFDKFRGWLIEMWQRLQGQSKAPVFSKGVQDLFNRRILNVPKTEGYVPYTIPVKPRAEAPVEAEGKTTVREQRVVDPELEEKRKAVKQLDDDHWALIQAHGKPKDEVARYRIESAARWAQFNLERKMAQRQPPKESPLPEPPKMEEVPIEAYEADARQEREPAGHGFTPEEAKSAAEVLKQRPFARPNVPPGTEPEGGFRQPTGRKIEPKKTIEELLIEASKPSPEARTTEKGPAPPYALAPVEGKFVPVTLAEGSWKGLPLRLVDDPGQEAFARLRNGTIILNPRKMYAAWEARAWTKPRVLRDGSKALPLAPNAFFHFDEFARFILEHEATHRALQRLPGESLGVHESRVNAIALGLAKRAPHSADINIKDVLSWGSADPGWSHEVRNRIWAEEVKGEGGMPEPNWTEEIGDAPGTWRTAVKEMGDKAPAANAAKIVVDTRLFQELREMGKLSPREALAEFKRMSGRRWGLSKALRGDERAEVDERDEYGQLTRGGAFYGEQQTNAAIDLPEATRKLVASAMRATDQIPTGDLELRVDEYKALRKELREMRENGENIPRALQEREEKVREDARVALAAIVGRKVRENPSAVAAWVNRLEQQANRSREKGFSESYESRMTRDLVEHLGDRTAADARTVVAPQDRAGLTDLQLLRMTPPGPETERIQGKLAVELGELFEQRDILRGLRSELEMSKHATTAGAPAPVIPEGALIEQQLQQLSAVIALHREKFAAVSKDKVFDSKKFKVALGREKAQMAAAGEITRTEGMVVGLTPEYLTEAQKEFSRLQKARMDAAQKRFEKETIPNQPTGMEGHEEAELLTQSKTGEVPEHLLQFLPADPVEAEAARNAFKYKFLDQAYDEAEIELGVVSRAPLDLWLPEGGRFEQPAGGTAGTGEKEARAAYESQVSATARQEAVEAREKTKGDIKARMEQLKLQRRAALKEHWKFVPGADDGLVKKDINDRVAILALRAAFEREVALEAGEAPAGMVGQDVQIGIDLSASGKAGGFFAKDQEKARRATKLISRGSPESSSEAYRQAAGEKANPGVYAPWDRVFISAEGNRRNRVGPDFEEIDKAIAARASFITDVKGKPGQPGTRSSTYNVGEREVASYLESKGYKETEPGFWTPAGKVRRQRIIIDPNDTNQPQKPLADDLPAENAKRMRNILLEARAIARAATSVGGPSRERVEKFLEYVHGFKRDQYLYFKGTDTTVSQVAKRTLGAIGDGLRTIFDPMSILRERPEAAGIMRKWDGWRNRITELDVPTLQKEVYEHFGEGERDLISASIDPVTKKTVHRISTDRVRAMARVFGKAFDEFHRMAVEVGAFDMNQFIDNFLPRIYGDAVPAGARSIFEKIPVDLNNPHSMERVFFSIVDAAKAGYHPATLDIGVLMGHYAKSMSHTISRVGMVTDLQRVAQDSFMWVTAGKYPPPGMKAIETQHSRVKLDVDGNPVRDEKGKILTERYYADEHLARLIDNYTKASVFDGNPTLKTLKHANQYYKRAVLMFDIYHFFQLQRANFTMASFVNPSMESFGDIYNYENASGTLGGAVKGAALAPFRGYKRGLEMMDPTNERFPIVQKLFEAGLTSSVSGQDVGRQVLEDIHRTTLFGTDVGKAWEKAKPWLGLPKAIEKWDNYLWPKVHTGIKVLAAVRTYERLLRENPHGDEERMLRDAVKIANDAGGGLSWQQKGRSKSTLDFMRFFGFAPDWAETRARLITQAYERPIEGQQLPPAQTWQEAGARAAKRTLRPYEGTVLNSHARYTLGNIFMTGLGTYIANQVIKHYFPDMKERKETQGIKEFFHLGLPLSKDPRQATVYDTLGPTGYVLQAASTPGKFIAGRIGYLPSVALQTMQGKDATGRPIETLPFLLGADPIERNHWGKLMPLQMPMALKAQDNEFDAEMSRAEKTMRFIETNLMRSMFHKVPAWPVALEVEAQRLSNKAKDTQRMMQRGDPGADRMMRELLEETQEWQKKCSETDNGDIIYRNNIKRGILGRFHGKTPGAAK